MILALLAIALGVVLLAFAADQFVLGAARVALLRNVPALVVGIVIIGFGTSAPELLISSIAASTGDADVAIGNIVGSNVANLSLLLGIGAIIIPLRVTSRTVRLEAPIVLAAVVLSALLVQGGGFNRWEGIVLLVALALALITISRPSPNDPIASEAAELASPSDHRLGDEMLRTAAGLVGTVAAAQLLLWGALDVADRSGLSGGFVGATLVAVGTSLPELVTVVQSARRGETDLIVGNLLGSNLFNALGVAGVVGLIAAEPIDASNLTTTAALASVLVAFASVIAMATGHTVNRREGAGLVVAYLCLVPLLS